MTRFAAEESFMFIQGSWAYRNIMERNPQMNLELIPFPVDKGQKQFVTLWIQQCRDFQGL